MHILYDLTIGGMQYFFRISRQHALCDFEMRSILGPTLKNQGVVLRFHF
jgi:hypothetical protein